MPPAATQAHPNALGALAALYDLADQHRWLADLLEPGTPDRRSRHLTPADRATLDRQTRAERHDIVEIGRQGLAPRGPSPAPLILGVLHAQMHALGAVMDGAYRATSALYAVDAPRYAGGGRTDMERFDAAVTYLGDVILMLSPELAGTLGTDFDRAAQMCGRVTGHGPQRHDLADDCPACGGRFLVATTWGTDDAVVGCTRCHCRGTDCGCQRPGRQPGSRHVWQAAEFGQLNRLLDHQAAA